LILQMMEQADVLLARMREAAGSERKESG